MEEASKMEKSYNGLLVVKARNGNFNAGFDGNPRTLPDGTIFATDKALKYCIREYLAEFEKLPIFVRRSRRVVKSGESSKLMYQLLEENFFTKLKMLADKMDKVNDSVMNSETKKYVKEWVDINLENIQKFEKDSKNVEKTIKDNFNSFLEDDEKVLAILKSFIDVRLFGVVFAVKGNVSLTGPVQISYGINKLQNSSAYPVQILSPYKNPNAKVTKDDEGNEKITAQTTTGEETRADEVYYVYNISVNSSNAKETGMTNADMELFKKALLCSVDTITSCTKYGCESVALVWLENDKKIILNNLDEFIDINKSEEKEVNLKLEHLKDYLSKYGFGEISKHEFSLDFDYSKIPAEKINVIYKKGKINVVE